MYHLAPCLVCCYDPTDAAPEFLDIHDSIPDICVIMCYATLAPLLVQYLQLHVCKYDKKYENRISFFTLFSEK